MDVKVLALGIILILLLMWRVCKSLIGWASEYWELTSSSPNEHSVLTTKFIRKFCKIKFTYLSRSAYFFFCLPIVYCILCLAIIPLIIIMFFIDNRVGLLTVWISFLTLFLGAFVIVLCHMIINVVIRTKKRFNNRK